jgi:hypothetical protein
MAQLLRMFVDIALWRRGPQDLPASATLGWLAAVFYAVVSALQVAMLGWDVRSTLLLVVLDLGLQAAWLWGLLKFFGKSPRFLQTMTAFLGVGALLTLMDIGVTSLIQLLGVTANSQGNPWPVLHLGLLLLLLGRILQQALERSLFMSMSVTLVIMLTITVVARGLLPGM